MDLKYFHQKLYYIILFLFCTTTLFAQTTTTIVTGTVIDAATKKPLPFVAVSFPGTTIGVNTDNQGKYSIQTEKPVTKVKASFLGYKDVIIAVTSGTQQEINMRMSPLASQLQEVVVKSGKKPKYRNKDNPAVELIRKVLENKEKNRPENYAYVE